MLAHRALQWKAKPSLRAARIVPVLVSKLKIVPLSSQFVDGGAYTPQLLTWCAEIKGKVMKAPVWWHLGRGPEGTAAAGRCRGWVRRESCS